jgi:hypothetical protein
MNAAPTLYLDFETELHDLCGRNPEICGREIGVEVHRSEQGFLQTAIPDTLLLGIAIARLK